MDLYGAFLMIATEREKAPLPLDRNRHLGLSGSGGIRLITFQFVPEFVVAPLLASCHAR